VATPAAEEDVRQAAAAASLAAFARQRGHGRAQTSCQTPGLLVDPMLAEANTTRVVTGNLTKLATRRPRAPADVQFCSSRTDWSAGTHRVNSA